LLSIKRLLNVSGMGRIAGLLSVAGRATSQLLAIS
jgi:hypothetical protein